MELLGWLLAGVFLGGGLMLVTLRFSSLWGATRRQADVAGLLRKHFHPVDISGVTISDRQFPARVRADLQRAIDRVFGQGTLIHHFCGVRVDFSPEGVSLSGCMIPVEHSPVLSTPPEYEEVDIGEDEPIRVLKNGLWMLERDGTRFAVLFGPSSMYEDTPGVRIHIAVPNSPQGTKITSEFFRHLEDSILKAESYRGKILSLEQAGHSYSGKSAGIIVHRLKSVAREQVILPDQTLELLDRNIIQFVQQRHQLARFQQSTKKGLLFYGAPGTGKTHTIHYLATALQGHTTLLISAEQVALLAEYMTLARLLQPSMVVIEDVDLIARDRTSMAGPCEEALLNKLLNEMDGLKEDAAVLFVLTTNRPEQLEAALASRPGRIDQAIEFPLPDELGRRKLVMLYSQGVTLPEAVINETVRRTDGVSAAFIKELMRRTVQFHIERDGAGDVSPGDLDSALEEMLLRGGSLNLKLLGAESICTRSDDQG
jgi:AAA+ superfamily predicted ATPase